MKVHLVRLGRLNDARDRRMTTGYRKDFVARHWWIDVWRWRLCLIHPVKAEGK